jgi:hypothetical protein
MIKETKRKGFNFYRSYYDVFNELSDKDKLMFTKALLDKQFLNIEPTNLTGMVKFAWISQYNSIDQQVKGYKSKTKDPMQGGWVGGATRVDLPPTLQEEEKEKEKGEGKEQLHKKKKQKFINWFNEEKKIKTGKKGTIKILSTTDDNNLKKLFKEYKMEDFKIAFDNMFKSSWAVENGMCNISHLIRVDNFNKYLGQGASEGTGKTFSAFNK